MRTYVPLLILVLAAGATANSWAADPPSDDELAAIVHQVLREVPLIDGHNDAPWAIRDLFKNHLQELDFHDTTALESPMHTDLARLRQGGVGGQFWSVWVPTSLEGGEAVTAVLEQIDLVHRLVQRYPDDLELAVTADDVVRIHGQGKIASLIGMEGGYSIDSSLAVLRQLYSVGARYMTLTHWNNVVWADAATAPPELGGLSPFGKEVVREMNRIGMMVDLSHVSAEVMGDVLDLTRVPVIFSHSNAAALNPHPRNVPDEILARLAENGGVVMVNFGSFFVSWDAVGQYAARKAEEVRLESLYPGKPEQVEKHLASWREANPTHRGTLADLADHIDHIREVAGIDHVGLGSDFDGVGSLPEGLDDVSSYPNLLVELMRRGYTRQDIAKIAGLNVLRVMREVEAAAARLQATEQPRDAWIDELDSSEAR